MKTKNWKTRMLSLLLSVCLMVTMGGFVGIQGERRVKAAKTSDVGRFKMAAQPEASAKAMTNRNGYSCGRDIILKKGATENENDIIYTGEANKDREYYIPDQNLYANLLNQFDKDKNGILQRSECGSATKGAIITHNLNINWNDVLDYTGLAKCFPAISYFTISNVNPEACDSLVAELKKIKVRDIFTIGSGTNVDVNVSKEQLQSIFDAVVTNTETQDTLYNLSIIGKCSVDIKNIAQLKALTNLRLTGEALDLKGIKAADTIKTLELNGTFINGEQFINQLSSLKGLYLNTTSIKYSDLSKERRQGLESLRLMTASLQDVESFKDSPKLKSLFFQCHTYGAERENQNRITFDLSGLSSVYDLHIDNATTQLSDVILPMEANIISLTLSSYFIMGNTVANLDKALAKDVQGVYIKGFQVKDLSVFQDMNKLISLELCATGLESTEGIGRLQSLEKLIISGNQSLHALDKGINQLTKLTSLDLSCNGLEALPDLSAIPKNAIKIDTFSGNGLTEDALRGSGISEEFLEDSNWMTYAMTGSICQSNFVNTDFTSVYRSVYYQKLSDKYLLYHIDKNLSSTMIYTGSTMSCGYNTFYTVSDYTIGKEVLAYIRDHNLQVTIYLLDPKNPSSDVRLMYRIDKNSLEKNWDGSSSVSLTYHPEDSIYDMTDTSSDSQYFNKKILASFTLREKNPFLQSDPILKIPVPEDAVETVNYFYDANQNGVCDPGEEDPYLEVTTKIYEKKEKIGLYQFESWGVVCSERNGYLKVDEKGNHYITLPMYTASNGIFKAGDHYVITSGDTFNYHNVQGKYTGTTDELRNYDSSSWLLEEMDDVIAGEFHDDENDDYDCTSVYVGNYFPNGTKLFVYKDIHKKTSEKDETDGTYTVEHRVGKKLGEVTVAYGCIGSESFEEKYPGYVLISKEALDSDTTWETRESYRYLWDSTTETPLPSSSEKTDQTFPPKASVSPEISGNPSAAPNAPKTSNAPQASNVPESFDTPSTSKLPSVTDITAAPEVSQGSVVSQEPTTSRLPETSAVPVPSSDIVLPETDPEKEYTSEIGKNSGPKKADASEMTSAAAAIGVLSEDLKSDSPLPEAAITTKQVMPVLTTELMGETKKANRNLKVSVANDNDQIMYSWEFDYQKIDKDWVPEDGQQLDLSVSFATEKQKEIEEITGQNNGLYVAVNGYHGKLPGPALMTLYVGDKYKNGDRVYLYYYNEEKKTIEAIEKNGMVVDGGYVSYTLTHCSVYFISEDGGLEGSSASPAPSVVPADNPTENTGIQGQAVAPGNPVGNAVSDASGNGNAAADISDPESVGGAKTLGKVHIKKIKPIKGGKVKASWKKLASAKKYQVQYSLKKDMKNAKNKYIGKQTVIIKKLKKDKTYYFRVRAVNDETKGAWSAKRSIRIRK